jgi:hypothetical protein
LLLLAQLANTHFSPSPRRAKACGMTNDRTRQHLLGTWKLVAAVREEIPSGIKTEFLGATGKGAAAAPETAETSGRCQGAVAEAGRPPVPCPHHVRTSARALLSCPPPIRVRTVMGGGVKRNLRRLPKFDGLRGGAEPVPGDEQATWSRSQLAKMDDRFVRSVERALRRGQESAAAASATFRDR